MAGWVEDEAAVVAWITWFMLVTAGPVCLLLLLVTAAGYGRYATPSWGPCLPARPAWLLQELPALLLPLGLLLTTRNLPAPNQALLGLFLLHYTQRALVYPLLISNGKPTPVVLFLLAATFCASNGYIQGTSLTSLVSYPEHWVRDPRFVVGVLLFSIGLTVNIHSDHILRNLRKPGETGYKIPEGGAFEYVSGANFLGEVVEWWGFALAASTLPALAFAVFTTCNLAPRAWTHHRWYLDKFGDRYPHHRRALIPFLL